MNPRRLLTDNAAIPLAIVLCLFHHIAIADEPESVELPFQLKTGDEIRFERTTKRTTVNQGDVREGVGVRSFDIRVIEAGPNGFVVSVKYGKPKIEGSIYDDSPAIVHFNHLMSKFDLQLELDKSGQVADIRNWNQIAGGLNKAIDELEAEFKAMPGAGPLAIVDRQTLAAMFDSKESIQANSTRDFEILSFPFGKSFPLDESQETGIQKDSTMYRDTSVLRPGEKPDVVELTWTHAFDRDATKELLQKLQREAGNDPNQPIPAWDFYETYNDEQSTIYKIDRTAGRILELHSTHTNKSGESMSVYEVSYRVRPSP